MTPVTSAAMAILAHIPILVALPLFVLLFAAVAVAAHAIFRHFVSQQRLVEGHEVAGFIVAVVGVLYSVVIGFLVGAVWTDFSAAQETTNAEAGYVSDAFNFAGLLGPPQGPKIQRLIARYAITVRDLELSPAAPARADDSVALLLKAVRLVAATPQLPDRAGFGDILQDNTMRTQVLDSLRHIGDTRRQRLVQSQDRLPPGMLEAMILGAAIVIAFAFFFGVEAFFKQMMMTALLAGSIGLFFGLVIELSLPYSGAVQISRDAWNDVIATNHLDRSL
jgi:hypothetical protein